MQEKLVPRRGVTEIRTLRNEARAIELLAENTEVDPRGIEDYWATSAELINVVTEIDELDADSQDVAPDDTRIFELRSRLRTIAARLLELAAD
jgi:hypothetical protein